MVVLSVLFCCSVNNKSEQYKIIEYRDEVRTVKGESDNDDIGSFKIAYYGKYTAYEVWSANYDVANTKNIEGKIVNELVPSNDTTYKYFMVEKGKKIGLCYNSINDSAPKAFHLDSLEERLTIIRNYMDVYSLDLGKPISVTKNHKAKTEIERYFTKQSKEDADSIYRFYDKKLIDIDFSFSPRLDREKNSKLFMTLFVYLQKKKGTDIDSIKTERSVSIRKLDIAYNKGMIALFEKFGKDIKTFNFK
jgi:hypothetical protein